MQPARGGPGPRGGRGRGRGRGFGNQNNGNHISGRAGQIQGSHSRQDNPRDRSRSPYRANRERSRSPYRGDRKRERSRSPYRPNRTEQRGRSPPRGPRSSAHHHETKPAAPAVQASLPDEQLDPEEYMKHIMGFYGFRSTKNTKVPGNDKNYGVRVDKETRYRQYMNRTKGFNRPLSPTRPRRKGDQT